MLAAEKTHSSRERVIMPLHTSGGVTSIPVLPSNSNVKFSTRAFNRGYFLDKYKNAGYTLPKTPYILYQKRHMKLLWKGYFK